MNREIKFRGWDPFNKVMINPYCELKDNHFWGEDLVNTGFYTPSVVMQYTGLKDKNGVEIYEGDIVHYAVKRKICKTCSKKEISSELNYGISKFCPHCGDKILDIDFIEVRIVEYRNGGFAYFNKPDEDHYQSWPVYIAEIYIAWVEVIGNIHENPELL